MEAAFDAYFSAADLNHDGRISGQEAVAFFKGSGLPNSVLAQIWTYADKKHSGFLGRDDFYNSLKLVTVAQSGRQLTPDIVEAALFGPAFARIPAPRINIPTAYTKPRAMPFQELHHMTDGFSEDRLLGTGAFGRVYMGVRDTGEVIAIKKLKNYPELVEKSFMNELLNLMMVQHKNVIRLVGYCSETRDKVVEHNGKLVIAGEQERALCLEYMEGGTLEKLLSDESCGLDWEARYKIIKGVCHGLKHLHTGSRDPIYHLDLKPTNILLDKDQIPKIGDFGLSRLLDSAGTFVTETFSGTTGYMPPEYIDKREVSPKFDVFSLGVIIIEVIAGRNAYNNYKSELMTSEEFTDHVNGNWRKRVQPKAMSAVALLEVQECIKMALRCVEDNRVKRPSITEIVEELNMIDHHLAPFR